MQHMLCCFLELLPTTTEIMYLYDLVEAGSSRGPKYDSTYMHGLALAPSLMIDSHPTRLGYRISSVLDICVFVSVSSRM
jgi:hypothetical protein